jgi:hypothetical protein
MRITCRASLNEPVDNIHAQPAVVAASLLPCPLPAPLASPSISGNDRGLDRLGPAGGDSAPPLTILPDLGILSQDLLWVWVVGDVADP